MVDINKIRILGTQNYPDFLNLIKLYAFYDKLMYEPGIYFDLLIDYSKISKDRFQLSRFLDASSYYGFYRYYSKEAKKYLVSKEIRMWDERVIFDDEKLHELRKEFIKQDRAFYEKIIKNLSRIKVDISDANNFLISGCALIKLYLNISLNEDESNCLSNKIISILITEEHLSNSFLDLCSDKEFISSMPKENQLTLLDVQERSVKLGNTQMLGRFQEPQVDKEFLSELSYYLKFGIDDSNRDDAPQIMMYESFYQGKFEETLKYISEVQKLFKRKYGFALKDHDVIAMQQFARMMTNKDIASMTKQLASFMKKDPDKSDLSYASTYAVDYLYNARSGNDKIKFAHYEVSPLSILKRYLPWSDKLIILSALYNSNVDMSSYKTECKEVIHNLYRSYPALAKRLYNSFSTIVGEDFIPELKNTEFFDFNELVDKESVWKNQLNSIMDLLDINKKPKKSTAKAKKQDERKLAWVFGEQDNYGGATPCVITLDEDNDVFSSDIYDIKYFFNSRSAKHTFLTEKDRAIASNFERLEYYRNSYTYAFSKERTLPFLKDHPYIYVKDKETGKLIHLTYEDSKVILKVSQDKDKLKLELEYGYYGNGNTRYIFDINNKILKVFHLEKIHYDLIDILKNGSVQFPVSALNEVIALGQSSSVQLSYDIASNKQKALAKPVLLLNSNGKLFDAKIRIKAIDDDDCPLRIPGTGEDSIVINKKDSGMPVMAKRDFKLELDAVQKFVKDVPEINNLYDDGDYAYSTDDLLDFLKLLEAINSKKDKYSIQWNSANKLRVAGSINSSSFKLKGDIGLNDYLSISGDVQLSEDRYISLKSLLKSIDKNSGNYIQLDDETYIAITADLKKRLEKLNAVTVAGKGGELLAHPLAGNTIENILEDLDCSFSKKVTSLIDKRDKALALDFAVPKTLNAQLRSYQVEGYEWLCRLEAWGVGACLADDMGLGKTIQTISAILKLASKGPAMIVAPTSVCPNWESEIHKFAPTLTVKRLKEADNREEMITSIKAGEVLIVSYGLFAIESKLLSSVQWQLAVYDEAQALKNSMTQRAKSATQINSKMSVALTGTPIENNLDDLWSIFNIINPGLLGSKTDFHKKFANAHTDKVANKMLKLLISPFILRRLKGDVLEDLPPRTEQVISVEPSVREKELYETLRLSTIEDLEKNKLTPNKNGQRRLQILSALTKLRQFCCDPSLLGNELKTGKVSSKTAAFVDLLEEALSGGHRLLVFSQFVSYLTEIRNTLDKMKISYQYLDGTTPEKKRASAISDFQNGIGDVFLISLKAGGQGLNLTGADYVVHLDPWWNPAVEDQATDRAYRIGQTRPVNVFRLVIKDSLEEKILELHAKKREVAADFLEGTANVAAEAMKLSEEELLDLLN